MYHKHWSKGKGCLYGCSFLGMLCDIFPRKMLLGKVKKQRYSGTSLTRSWFSYFPGFYVQNCRSRRAPSCPGAFSFFYIFADRTLVSLCPLRHISTRFYCICFVSNSIDKREKFQPASIIAPAKFSTIWFVLMLVALFVNLSFFRALCFHQVMTIFV